MESNIALLEKEQMKFSEDTCTLKKLPALKNFTKSVFEKFKKLINLFSNVAIKFAWHGDWKLDLLF